MAKKGFKMACIKCSNVDSCGTIKRYLIDLSRGALITELNRATTKAECKDFSFISIAVPVLKQKIMELCKRSEELKMSLKRANKADRKNRL